jgi:hypothetical protein
MDQYFREVLESPDLKYNKQDWKGLEKMLPQKSKKRGLSWWFPASAAAALVLLFTSLWLLNKPLTNTENTVKAKQETQGTDLDDSNLPHETNIARQESPKTQFEDQENSAPVSEESDGSGRLLGHSRDHLSEIPFQKGTNPVNDFAVLEESTFNLPFIPSRALKGVQYADSLLSNAGQLSSVTVNPPTRPESIEEKPMVSEKSEKGRFSLGLSFSPDINSVSQITEGSFGSSFGLSASYRISARLSLNTAVAYSKKVYSALPNEYKAPWATSSTAKYAESIDADCRVLDIPLNLKYSFLESPKRTLFASAGVSSYFMLKEKYTLILDKNPGGYPAYSNPSYAYKNKNQHLLNVLNLSVGIAKPISKQTSLVIEPYARFPLTGVGQGKVNLKSVGLSLQLQYNLKKRTETKATSVNVPQ